MADKRKRGTQQIAAVDDSADGARGLAAFEARRKRRQEAGRAADDAELRQARLGASPERDDPDLVATSPSYWSDDARRPVRKKGGAGKWIAGILVAGGLGVGAYFAIPYLQGTSEANEEPGDDATPSPTAASSDDETEADAQAAVAEADATTARAEDAASVAEPEPAPGEVMLGGEPAEWAKPVERTNPWVAVAGAQSRIKLGLTYEQARDEDAAVRTGLRPEHMFLAPTEGYRIQSHEVTWGELEKATTIEALSTLVRPAWVSDNARRRARYPATGLPWSLARDFCHSLGGDLPSEAEWEWAARGPDDNYWPWGRKAFNRRLVHIIEGRRTPLVPVKTSRLDRTPGRKPIYDLLGNAKEWTRDRWRPAEVSAKKDPRAETHRAVRGWPLHADKDDVLPAEGSTYRSAGCADPSCVEAEKAALERIGFRCVKKGEDG